MDDQTAPVDNVSAAYSWLTGNGYTPAQAAGVIGNFQGESGQRLNTGAVDKGDGSDGSDSIGIGQWNSDRAQALKDYAASQGKPWTDLTTQLEFAHSELQGPENKAYKNLQAAQTPQDAAQAMLGYERPANWNVPGAHADRLQYAGNVYGAMNGGAPLPAGQPQQTAQAAPQAPPAAPQAHPGVTGMVQNLMAGKNVLAAVPAGSPQAMATPSQMAAALPTGASPYTPPQPAQITMPQRKPVDLTKLRAQLAQFQPFFPQGGQS